jgi:hypothetical protein
VSRAIRRYEKQLKAREISTLLALASDTRTAPQKMVEIAQTCLHRTVLATLARNVSCPPAALGLLVTQVPFAVAKNPALPLVLLEDPDFLNRSGEPAVLRMLTLPDLPPVLLTYLQYHRSPIVQNAVQNHVSFPQEQRTTETNTSPCATVCTWIQSFPVGDETRLQETKMLRLIVGNEAYFSPTPEFPPFLDTEAGAAATDPHATRTTLTTLARHPEASVRFAALRRADRLGYDLRPVLAAYYAEQGQETQTPPTTQAQIAWNLTRFAPLNRLESSIYPIERLCAVLHPRLDHHQRERRKQDANRIVRAMARSQSQTIS